MRPLLFYWLILLHLILTQLSAQETETENGGSTLYGRGGLDTVDQPDDNYHKDDSEGNFTGLSQDKSNFGDPSPDAKESNPQLQIFSSASRSDDSPPGTPASDWRELDSISVDLWQYVPVVQPVTIQQVQLVTENRPSAVQPSTIDNQNSFTRPIFRARKMLEDTLARIESNTSPFPLQEIQEWIQNNKLIYEELGKKFQVLSQTFTQMYLELIYYYPAGLMSVLNTFSLKADLEEGKIDEIKYIGSYSAFLYHIVKQQYLQDLYFSNIEDLRNITGVSHEHISKTRIKNDKNIVSFLRPDDNGHQTSLSSGKLSDGGSQLVDESNVDTQINTDRGNSYNRSVFRSSGLQNFDADYHVDYTDSNNTGGISTTESSNLEKNQGGRKLGKTNFPSTNQFSSYLQQSGLLEQVDPVGSDLGNNFYSIGKLEGVNGGRYTDALAAKFDTSFPKIIDIKENYEFIHNNNSTVNLLPDNSNFRKTVNEPKYGSDPGEYDETSRKVTDDGVVRISQLETKNFYNAKQNNNTKGIGEEAITLRTKDISINNIVNKENSVSYHGSNSNISNLHENKSIYWENSNVSVYDESSKMYPHSNNQFPASYRIMANKNPNLSLSSVHSSFSGKDDNRNIFQQQRSSSVFFKGDTRKNLDELMDNVYQSFDVILSMRNMFQPFLEIAPESVPFDNLGGTIGLDALRGITKTFIETVISDTSPSLRDVLLAFRNEDTGNVIDRSLILSDFARHRLLNLLLFKDIYQFIQVMNAITSSQTMPKTISKDLKTDFNNQSSLTVSKNIPLIVRMDLPSLSQLQVELPLNQSGEDLLRAGMDIAAEQSIILNSTPNYDNLLNAKTIDSLSARTDQAYLQVDPPNITFEPSYNNYFLDSVTDPSVNNERNDQNKNSNSSNGYFLSKIKGLLASQSLEEDTATQSESSDYSSRMGALPDTTEFIETTHFNSEKGDQLSEQMDSLSFPSTNNGEKVQNSSLHMNGDYFLRSLVDQSTNSLEYEENTYSTTEREDFRTSIVDSLFHSSMNKDSNIHNSNNADFFISHMDLPLNMTKGQNDKMVITTERNFPSELFQVKDTTPRDTSDEVSLDDQTLLRDKPDSLSLSSAAGDKNVQNIPLNKSKNYSYSSDADFLNSRMDLHLNRTDIIFPNEDSLIEEDGTTLRNKTGEVSLDDLTFLRDSTDSLPLSSVAGDKNVQNLSLNKSEKYPYSSDADYLNSRMDLPINTTDRIFPSEYSLIEEEDTTLQDKTGEVSLDDLTQLSGSTDSLSPLSAAEHKNVQNISLNISEKYPSSSDADFLNSGMDLPINTTDRIFPSEYSLIEEEDTTLQDKTGEVSLDDLAQLSGSTDSLSPLSAAEYKNFQNISLNISEKYQYSSYADILNSRIDLPIDTTDKIFPSEDSLIKEEDTTLQDKTGEVSLIDLAQLSGSTDSLSPLSAAENKNVQNISLNISEKYPYSSYADILNSRMDLPINTTDRIFPSEDSLIKEEDTTLQDKTGEVSLDDLAQLSGSTDSLSPLSAAEHKNVQNISLNKSENYPYSSDADFLNPHTNLQQNKILNTTDTIFPSDGSLVGERDTPLSATQGRNVPNLSLKSSENYSLNLSTNTPSSTLENKNMSPIADDKNFHTPIIDSLILPLMNRNSNTGNIRVNSNENNQVYLAPNVAENDENKASNISDRTFMSDSNDSVYYSTEMQDTDIQNEPVRSGTNELLSTRRDLPSQSLRNFYDMPWVKSVLNKNIRTVPQPSLTWDKAQQNRFLTEGSKQFIGEHTHSGIDNRDTSNIMPGTLDLINVEIPSTIATTKSVSHSIGGYSNNFLKSSGFSPYLLQRNGLTYERNIGSTNRNYNRFPICSNSQQGIFPQSLTGCSLQHNINQIPGLIRGYENIFNARGNTVENIVRYVTNKVQYIFLNDILPRLNPSDLRLIFDRNSYYLENIVPKLIMEVLKNQNYRNGMILITRVDPASLTQDQINNVVIQSVPIAVENTKRSLAMKESFITDFQRGITFYPAPQYITRGSQPLLSVLYRALPFPMQSFAEESVHTAENTHK